jgi:hypothetical protein
VTEDENDHEDEDDQQTRKMKRCLQSMTEDGNDASSQQIRAGSGVRTIAECMAFYSGCSLIVAIPQDYLKKDDLTQFLASRLDGCEISVVEDPTAKEPYPEKVMIREDLLGSPPGRDAASPSNPAATENRSEFLMAAAGEAIHEFLQAKE